MIRHFGHITDSGRLHIKNASVFFEQIRRFLSGTRFNEKRQKEYSVIRSTSEINQQAFNQYIEKCREFSLDLLGTYVLNGNEYMKGEAFFRSTERND